MRSFPDEICRDDLIVFFTLSAEDIVEVKRLRAAHNRLGFALSLGALRYLGFIPVDLSTAPPEAVEFVADQVDADPGPHGVRGPLEDARGPWAPGSSPPWLPSRDARATRTT